MKKCTKCGEIKDESEFPTQIRRGKIEKRANCKKCHCKETQKCKKNKQEKTKIEDIYKVTKHLNKTCEEFIALSNIEKENNEMKKLLHDIKKACEQKNSGKLKFAVDSAEKYIKKYEEVG